MCATKYCPNCVSEMQSDNKQLGGVTNWYKCPSCGLREEVLDEETEEKQLKAEEAQRLKQKKRDARGYYDREGYNTY